MGTENTKYKRISRGSTFALIFVAVCFDVLELLVDWIPGVGQILSLFIDIFALIVFLFWFAMLGVGMTNPKTSKNFWITNIIELLPIPLIDFGPLTIGIISTIINIQTEDSGGSVNKPNPNVVRIKRGDNK